MPLFIKLSLLNRDLQRRVLGFCLIFSRRDDGLRKSNWVGEDDGLKQKKQIKMKQFPFQEEYE